jgi:hypothetical protein
MVQATDAAGQSTTSEASVSQPPLGVAVSPASASLVETETRKFTATVTGAANTAVIWSAFPGPAAPPGAQAGHIDPDGSYDAPRVSSAYTVILTATSQVDYRTSASVAVLVQPEVITDPAAPSGPSSGTSGTLYQFSASGATSSLGHPLQYTFFWGDGSSSGWTPPGVSISFHSWAAPGSYFISAQARCSIHPWEISSFFPDTMELTVTGESISTPDIPGGPTSAITSTSYTYSTGNAVSSAGNAVQYRFSWGDGSVSPWLPTGTLSSPHSWPGPGTYQITAQARSAVNTSVLSGVSSALTVVVTANETISTPTGPTGPTAAASGVASTFTTGGAASSLGNPVRYLFNWGDGTTSGWIAAGVTSASHAWSQAGSYTVVVVAADANNLLIQSAPSSGITVTVQ